MPQKTDDKQLLNNTNLILRRNMFLSRFSEYNDRHSVIENMEIALIYM